MLIGSVTVGDILDSVRKTNLIDSLGLLAQDHELYLALINGQVKSPDQIGQIVHGLRIVSNRFQPRNLDHLFV